MQLEAPGALWLGLAAPAILLLWMLRPRRPRLRVPSLLLWTGSPAERQSVRPWQRLRNHPLLWLQIAVALLLATAAARPYLPAQGASQHLIVLLDASGSMRAQDVAPDRFAVARQAVVDLARSLGPGQTMTVIRLDDEPRVLVAGTADAAQVAAAAEGQTASFGPADVATGLALAAGLSTGPAEWVLVSDGGLPIPEGARRPGGTSLRVVQVGQSAGNVAATGLTTRAGTDGLTLQAGVRNAGTAAATGRLQLFADGQLVGAREWRAEPGAETHVSWSELPFEARTFEARLVGLTPGSNALEHDDRAWAVVAAPQEARVLLVSTGNTFLERALTIYPGLRTFRTAPADWQRVVAEDTGYPLAVLDRLWSEEPPPGNTLFIGPPQGPGFRPQEIQPRVGHPLLRHVDWTEVHVAGARRVPLDGTWDTIVDSDGGPLLAVREVAGRRQAVLTFDLAQADLALRPAFPVLMSNLLDWLLPHPEGTARVVAPGSAAAIDPLPLAQEVWVEGPDGTRTELAPPWPPRPFRPPAPGLYQIVQGAEGGQQRSVLVAEGYHPQEADLVPHALVLPAEGDAASASALGALTWWPWLAGLVLLFSLFEWWTDARGH